jgi:hypothetical protein
MTPTCAILGVGAGATSTVARWRRVKLGARRRAWRLLEGRITGCLG